MEKLQSNLEEIVERLFGERTRVELGLAPEGTGADYATNVAMKLAKVVRKSPDGDWWKRLKGGRE